MSENRFGSLLNLVDLDQAIVAAQKKSELLIHALHEAEQKKQSLFDHENMLKQQMHDIRKGVDFLELDMKALDSRETQKKKQLDAIHSLKEYTPLKAELDAIHEEQQQLEQELLTKWNKLEQVQHESQVYSNNLAELITLSEEKIASIISEQTEVTRTTHDLEGQRRIGEHNVPQEWLTKYTMMHAQVSDPVVPIVEGACSACFNHVTPQDALSIQRGALLQCKGCYRLLYMPENRASNG